MAKPSRKQSKKYFGYYQFGDYERLHPCCYKAHSSWQAAKSHAESQCFSGSNVIVREYDHVYTTVYEGRKERG